ncbi:MAG: hypothetical protein IKR48_05110 [Kiritimatiellae bacterium]|nr:hypothetical protein [Kiritimatiellia bacterium]
MKILQFGTGCFLRAFIDWMIQRMNERCGLDAEVTVVQSTSSGTGKLLNEAHGRYPLLIRGVVDGRVVEELSEVSCIRACYSAETEWNEVVLAALDPDLTCVFSNTTEAGITYLAEEPPTELVRSYLEPQCRKEWGALPNLVPPPSSFVPTSHSEESGKLQSPRSFPGKLAALLWYRFRTGLSGVTVFPCELIDRNGETLKRVICRLAQDWKLPPEFLAWLDAECEFCDTLVDRIVPGTPKTEEERKTIRERYGVDSPLLVCAEPFHFLAVQGSEKAKELLPFEAAGLSVRFVPDIRPYRERKVRLLNGAHTGSVAIALLAGLTEVGEMTHDRLFTAFLHRLMLREILPTVPLPMDEKRGFASDVLERFSNPFLHHRLESIALNSISKWRVRDWPVLLDWAARNRGMPAPLLTLSFAALLVLYVDNESVDTGKKPLITIRDDETVLAFFHLRQTDAFRTHDSTVRFVRETLVNDSLWGTSLADHQPDGFAEEVAAFISWIRAFGMRQTLTKVLDDDSC